MLTLQRCQTVKYILNLLLIAPNKAYFMLRIISFNANGLRSAANKGFFSWLDKQNADILCVQETKAQEHQLTHAIFKPAGYHAYYFDAEKKGYSGVAIFTRKKPDLIKRGLGWQEADTEGRYIQVDFGNLSIASIYLPSGTSGDARQAIKYDFLNRYEKILEKQKKESREYILCGDWNIAHKEIDLKNWKANQKNSGFLPEERAWLDKLFGSMGYVDAFRVINSEPDQYTWWSHRARAFENNVGWRIDYHIVTPGLKNRILSGNIYREEKFSDHAPLTLDYNL
jgi:exodeoxyribonuclease-3